MEPRRAERNKISRHLLAEAAVWVADLHAPDRDADLERRVRQWIAEDPKHAAAFELATEAWQETGELRRPVSNSRSRATPIARPAISRAVGAAVVSILAVLMVAIYFARDETLTTGSVEQKTVELSDGTQVSLNANSRLVVKFDEQVRKVRLVAGEALFSVSKNPSRPFVVVIGDRKVVALGTSFMVRCDSSCTAGISAAAFEVTLVEGRVTVEPLSWPNAVTESPTQHAILLSPGERLRFNGGRGGTVDKPSIERITAWRRGQLIFDNSLLGEAAAEFNRYGSTRIQIDTMTVSKLRVGGVFRIGDAASFAQAMAQTYHLRIITRGKTIVLTDRPEA